jgi:hypothetical protein
MLELHWWTAFHFPDCYGLQLARAIRRLEGKGFGIDGRKASWAEANAEKKMVWASGSDYVYLPGSW